MPDELPEEKSTQDDLSSTNDDDDDDNDNDLDQTAALLNSNNLLYLPLIFSVQ
ncbi:unnamed protein product, partial [Adineta ricciae]